MLYQVRCSFVVSIAGDYVVSSYTLKCDKYAIFEHDDKNLLIKYLHLKRKNFTMCFSI